MGSDNLTDDSRSNKQGNDGLSLTRRTALGMLGVGTVSAAMTGSGATADGNGNGGTNARPWNQDIDAQGHDLFDLHGLEVEHIYTAARDADVIVWKDGDDVFHADNCEETVASGEDVIEVTQAAVDSLTEDRDWKEKVAVVSPSTVGPVETTEDAPDPYEDSDVIEGIELPSYTVLDVPAPMHVEEEGDESLVDPVRISDAEHVEIPNLHVVGNPRFGMFLQSVRNLRLGNVHIEMTDASPRGNIGVRIDGFAHGRGDDTVRCEDIQIDNVYVENSGGHAFETYAVDRIQVGKVMVNGTEAGAGVLLNDTTDATVGSVVGTDIDPGGGYAGFRVANDTHDVTCDQVIVRGGARGIFGVSGSHNITIGEVNISEMLGGIFIEDNQNVTIQGGVVKNCDWEAVRIHSRNDFQHDPSNGVTISNLRTYDDRDEDDRAQEYGIYVSGEQTSNVRIIDCDVRGGGTDQNIRVDADETVLVNNHGGGLETGTTTLEGEAEPAAVVEGVSPFGYQQPSLRADPVESANATFAYDHYFVWNADDEAWDLHFEWKHDPNEDVEVQYVVDNPRADIGEWDPDDGGGEFKELPEGTYQITPEINADDIVVSAVELEDGADIYTETVSEVDDQEWQVTELEDGIYRLNAADDSELVFETADGDDDTGAQLQLGTWEDEEHQRFEIVPQSPDTYSIEPIHATLAVDVWEGDAEPGAELRHWDADGGSNQLFSFDSSDS